MDTSIIGDGEHWLRSMPSYWAQFADRTRVSEFLTHPPSLISDTYAETFGFRNVDDYAFWAPRLCGLVCVKMCLDAFGVAGDRSVAELTEMGVALGGYIVNDQDGQFVDKGWYYRPLVELAEKFGVSGSIEGKIALDDIPAWICEDVIAVLSVHPGVIRGDTATLPSGALRGGHLVVATGFRVEHGEVTGIYVNNPSGREPSTQERAFVDLERFREAFAGRGMLFWTTTASPLPNEGE